MRNKRLILALAGAIVCGLLAVMLVTRYISTLQTFQKDLNNVVIAKAEIPLGAKIVAEQLSLAPIPNGSAPEGVFRKLDEVVGRVAVTPIGLREPITKLKLAPEGVDAGLSAVIPEGYRAMTVKVDNIIGVSGFVMPGSYVDVVAVIVPVTQATSQGPISKIVLQSIKVLASGQKIDSPQDQRQPSDVGAVTLLVTPEQAEKLVLAANEGKLQLVMRNFGDQEDTRTPGANKQTLLTGEAIAREPEAPSQKAAEEKPATSTRKRPKRASHVAQNVDKPAKLDPPPPVSKNSIELIEGAKRREVVP
jgi:pilus assembly protein CpaB